MLGTKRLMTPRLTGASAGDRALRSRMPIFVRLTAVACSLVLLITTTATSAPPNPYCVSGADWSSGGTMVRLGMPSDSLGYIWDSLIPSNLANMVRPCKYWLLVGGHHQAHGYHEDTDTIDDPTTFGNWVAAHPGKIWIIGNEPNAGSQDGLTTAQYARMFKKYYDFIRSRDTTARFAVAGLAWMADASSLNAQINWWNQTLADYRSQFGGPMPIDIWNCHAYVRVGLLSPDRVMSDFITPFRQYTQTVEGGLYAGAELWVTEFGVAIWSTPLDPYYIRQFIQQMCPRFEAGGVNRFFWFIGPWPGGWDPMMNDTALVGPAGLPTLIGQAYGDLARSYPNAVPAPPASFPPAVPEVASDFETTTSPWQVVSGDWAIDAGGYRQSSLTKGCGAAACLPYEYRDVFLDADIRIDATANNDPIYWAGVTLRGGWIWEDDDTWTYLVFLRRNGDLNLWTSADKVVASVPGAVADTSVYHHLRVELVGRRVRIGVDGVTRIEWDDLRGWRSSGIIALRACKTDCTFDNVEVRSICASDFDIDADVDLEDFAVFQYCFNGPNNPSRNPTACDAADLDRDTDVDLADFSAFQRCFNGPNRPAKCR